MESLYSEHLLRHARSPHNYKEGGVSACVVSVLNEGCADDLTLYIDVEHGVVKDASFVGTLCALSTASASLLTDYMHGKYIDELRLMTPGLVYDLLGVTITESRTRCALLCYQALQKSLTTCFPSKN